MSEKLKALHLEDFVAHLNTEFLIPMADEEGKIESYYPLQLLEVTALGNKDQDEKVRGRQSFSLIFRHPDKNQYLLQRMYLVQHTQMGDLELFLVPLGPSKDGMEYQVVFT